MRTQGFHARRSPGNRWRFREHIPPTYFLVIVGLVVIPVLLGPFASGLPSSIRVLLSIGLIILPGAALVFLTGVRAGSSHPIVVLGISAATGLAILSALGFLAILSRMRLAAIAQFVMVAQIAIAAIFILMSFRLREGIENRGFRRISAIVLVVIAVALAFTTILTPRDDDDWFYLAHIRDYVNGIPINSEDAVFDSGLPASPRAWYGGWWVAEAILSKAGGVDPVRFHQVLLPILLLPFSVFALFTLARQVFGSDKIAYLACFLQVIFFISSAFPSDSAGWAFLCRTAQDKTVACLIMVPVITALALALWTRISSTEWGSEPGSWWGLACLYGFCLVGATLVHPMAAVWSGIAIIPFIALETLRDRRRRTAAGLAIILIPFLISGPILLEGRGATVATLEGRQPGPHEGMGMTSVLKPDFPDASRRFEAGDRVLALSDRISIGHPLLITRYPLAMLGLVLSFVLLKYVRESPAARYLAVLTVTVLLLTFLPGLAGIVSAVITWKMLYRLTWLLPWGFTIAFVLTKLARRAAWAWVIAVALALLLCKGNPLNYFAGLRATRDMARTSPELTEVLRVLAGQPAPQGVVLASAQTSQRIPAFAGDAYPVAFRSEGPMTHEDLRDLFQTGNLSEAVRKRIEAIGVRYVLAEKSRSLGRAFELGVPWATLVYENKGYGLWRIGTVTTAPSAAHD
jgi:hypothetical protein